MRAIALDIGRKRTGIAASDATGSIASPVKVLPTGEVTGMARTFRLVLEDYEPDVLVVGLPTSLDGTENDHAAWVREVAAGIGKATGIELVFQDERLSSAEAKRIMREQGMDERAMRGKLDMVAASLILQGYLDARLGRG
ncbi:MAG: Holliday junction resolvase RuvX [Coriobacteriales bacterium]